ncbi:uncharacterized protein LOC134819384 isoform X2 [Bolinopsis microptera]|uniref:uncharacterized protein LOC134819384 isoform X2 n=1 Tax=Bolinopsis microptera TaxID=2820187 RepID=UPI00307A67E8
MAAQSFHCVLCQDSYLTVEDFNNHEKQELHRKEFERRMDGTSIGLLLCKCCFISVQNLKSWDEHIKSKGHVKLVTQSEYLGKRCIWSVPGVKMKDGSIKLCKDMNQLFDCGWKDPDYVNKVTNQSLLESDLIIGMNCISLKSMVNDLPLYHCSLCCVDFHHNDRNHVIGRHHKINVVWNWEKKTADRIAKGLDFPKPSTRAKAQAELDEVTKKIFKMEQDCLDDDQFDLYQVMSTKKLPNDLGKTPVNRRPLMPTASTADERSKSSDEPDQIINVRSRSRTPTEPPNKKPRDAPAKPLLPNPHSKPLTTKSKPQPKPHLNPQIKPTDDIHQHQAITIPPPMPLPKISAIPGDVPSSVDMNSFSTPFPEEDDIPSDIRAEIELFDLMEELQLSGNFQPPETAKEADPTKFLNILFTLGEGLLEYQTKEREIPMELPRDDIKEITNTISNIEEIIQRFSAPKSTDDNENAEVPVTS